MKTPQFWQKKNLISYLLLPLTWIYILASHLRNFFISPTKINKPIICIGNFTAGGAGKTPIALAIGKMLKEMKVDFAYLGHGFKAKNDDLIVVNKDLNNAAEVGDEALLLSEISDVFIAKNRVIAAKKIEEIPEKKLIIMDDGLQNPSLKKDLKILVIDGEYGFGNNMILPAGPLRIKPSRAIKNIDLVIIIGEDRFNLAQKFKDKKVILAKIIVTNQKQIVGKNFIAFCGIGRPEKFFNSLKKSGYNLIKEISFPDHYPYNKKDLEELLALSKRDKTVLITTKKDFVKFDKKYKKQIQFLDIEVEFKMEDQQYIADKLQKIINEN